MTDPQAIADGLSEAKHGDVRFETIARTAESETVRATLYIDPRYIYGSAILAKEEK